MHKMAAEEAAPLLASPWVADDLEELTPGPLVVDFATCPSAWPPALPALPRVMVALLRSPDVPPAVIGAFDVAVADPAHHPQGWVALASNVEESLNDLVAKIEAHPQAALAATQVLRATERAAPAVALTVESLTYSMLQAGPEFQHWLATQAMPAPAPQPGDSPAVITERDGTRLNITLNRPEVRNAVDRSIRDGLVEALRLAAADTSITEVVLRGAGPAFCSGGDLREFGTLPDPVTAHQVRLTRSPAMWAAITRRRLRSVVQGACVGAGVELAAWSEEVVAAPDAFFQLPEIGLGLIPGAGGTASIPRRIGRQRTAYLALSGQRLDATTALEWGLVDRLT